MEEIIRIDIDSKLLPLWKGDWIGTRKAILKSLGYKLERAIIKPSGEALPWLDEKQEGRGFHAWLHISSPKPLTDLDRLKLQFLLGDDLGRCWINYLRITRRHMEKWDKIFGYVLWRGPLEEPCKSCSLRRHIEELSQDVDFKS